MKLTFSYTFADYREANRAHARRNKLRWLIRTSFTVLVLLLACLMISFLVRSTATPGTGRIEWANLRPILPWLLASGGLIGWALAAPYLTVRRAWLGQPAMQLQQTVEISDAGLVIDDEQSRNEYKWNAFIRLVESRNLFLFFPSNLVFIMIPKRAIPPGELDAFRMMLNERLTLRGAFPVLPPKPSDIQSP
jgi:hypothetical protein